MNGRKTPSRRCCGAKGRGARRRILAARRRGIGKGKATDRALVGLAGEAERIEMRLRALEAAPPQGQAPVEAQGREALGRLETALDAAAGAARRMARCAAPESATFTEGRSDQDWRAVAVAGPREKRSRDAEMDAEVDGASALDWMEY